MAIPLPNLTFSSNPYAGPSGNTGGTVGGSPTFNIKDDFFDKPSWSKYLNGGGQTTSSATPALSASIGPWPVLLGLLIMAGMYLFKFKKGG